MYTKRGKGKKATNKRSKKRSSRFQEMDARVSYKEKNIVLWDEATADSPIDRRESTNHE
jgi:hypothetical protein